MSKNDNTVGSLDIQKQDYYFLLKNYGNSTILVLREKTTHN